MILEMMAGGQTLKDICQDPRLPTATTVRLWVSQDVDGMRDAYRLACELQADAWADEIVEIADGDGDIDRDRLRIAVRERLMRFRAPSVY